MCLETYVLFNWAADLSLLCVICRSLGCFQWRRILLASALCAAYAALAAFQPATWGAPSVQLVLLALVSMLVTRRIRLRYWRGTAIGLGTAAMICAGIAALVRLTGSGGGALGIAAGSLLLSLLFAARPPGLNSFQVTLCLQSGSGTARFPALIDTGNRLREPVSGLPVLIAEAGLLREILPSDGYRLLRYGAVGSEGQMSCFKPAEIWIERGLRRCRAPEAWVAVAPGRLPGPYQALAPTEFALFARS